MKSNLALHAIAGLLAVAACRAPAPVEATSRLSASAPSASSHPAAPQAADAPRPAPEAVPVGDEGDDEAPDNHAGGLDAKTPAAPCDFERPYRGTIGETPVSWLLTRRGDVVQGYAAYDRGSGQVELAGVVEPDGGLRLAERVGGRDLAAVRVHCEAATGALLGSFTQGRTSQSIRLAPRGKGGAPLVERRKKIGELVDDVPSCTWDVRSPAVFGLDDAPREARINAALRVRFDDETSLERRVVPCPPRGDNHVTGWYAIETDERGVLGVLHNGYISMGPTVHGQWNAAAGVVNIDVPTGKKLDWGDVVVSTDALRPVISSCIAFAAAKLEWSEYELEQNLQGLPAEEGEPSTIHAPTFLVLPDGVAVLLRNLPTVAAWSELSGPVISWGALVREGILAPRSPIARLWSRQPAHAPGVPACERIFVPKWMPARDRAR